MRNSYAQILHSCAATLVAGSLLATSLSLASLAQSTPRKNTSGDDSSVARGKYIVEGLAVCTQCHTPRNSSGTPDRTKWLQGAPVWLKPAMPVTDWPLEAPRIAGLVPGSDADMVKLLTTGIWRDGKPLRAPMPQFRMKRSDAEAVVAYLRSLSSSSSSQE
jgi:mono/diheme cytochrome c family protein